MKNMVTKIV